MEPSLDRVRRYVMSGLIDAFGEDIEIYETEPGRTKDTVNIYGKTRRGVKFGATVKIIDIWKTDV